MRGITKAFAGKVVANKDVNLTLRQGGLNAMGFNSADGNGVTAQ